MGCSIPEEKEKMTYTVIFRPSIKRDLRRLPRFVQRRVEELLIVLRSDPFPEGYRALAGYDHVYRLRVGEYRIIYEVRTEIRIIGVLRIRHRKDAYRRL